MPKVEFDTGIWVFREELEHSEGVCLANKEEEVFEFEDRQWLVDEESMVVKVR